MLQSLLLLLLLLQQLPLLFLLLSPHLRIYFHLPLPHLLLPFQFKTGKSSVSQLLGSIAVFGQFTNPSSYLV